MSELIEIKGWYQGTSNITKLAAVYSTKRRKFVKGYLAGSRTHGEILYRLLPGTYVFFEYFGWWRNDPPRELTAKLIAVSKDGSVKTLAALTIRFYNAEFLAQFPEQVRDFFNARPGYHTRPSLNFEKVYDEAEHEKLINLIMQNATFVEGGEHE
jgi:hypothetical protein